MNQCPKCSIPAQNSKCPHFKGSNSNLERTDVPMSKKKHEVETA